MEKVNDFVKENIYKLQEKLLDLTARNSLLNFKHGESSVSHVRLIDELPNELFKILYDKGAELVFKSLPELPDEPSDEKTPQFKTAVENAKLSDDEYIKDVKKLEDKGLDETAYENEYHDIERLLKNRVRKQLGLPTLKDALYRTNAQWAKECGFNSSFEMPVMGEEEIKEEKHTDTYIQTLLLPDELNRKILGLKRIIGSDMSEAGVNTFYAAFGFLEYIDDKSNKSMIAPLLLLPLNPIEEKKFKSKTIYSIKATGEPVEINKTLRKKLEQDFKLILPEFIDRDAPETEKKDTPESYFEKVQQLIVEHPKWKVRRYITLGRFQFSKLIMYEDLTSKAWYGGLESNKAIQSLLNGENSEAEIVFGESKDYEIDTDSDVERYAPVIVLDADSSQHSAIIDSMRGKNMVIYGPPGTGKSQTITNIIANALYLKKKVLFVAEKSAALNVVYNRLKKVGLENRCLELHSSKSKIRELYSKLKAGFDSWCENQHKAETSIPEDKIISQLKQTVASLRTASNLINESFKDDVGMNLFDIFWSYQKTKSILDEYKNIYIDKYKIQNPTEINKEKIDEIKENLDSFARYQESINQYGDIKNHPWYGIPFKKMGVLEKNNLLTVFKDCSKVLNDFFDDFDQFQQNCGWIFEPTIENVLNVSKNIDKFNEFLSEENSYVEKLLDDGLLSHLTEQKTKLLIEFVQYIDQYRELYKKYDDVLSDTSETIKDFNNFQEAFEWASDLGVLGKSAEEIRENRKKRLLFKDNWLDFYEEFQKRIDEKYLSLYCDELSEILIMLPEFDSEVMRLKEKIDLNSAELEKVAENAWKETEELKHSAEYLKTYFDFDADAYFYRDFLDAYKIYKHRSIFSFLSSDFRRAKRIIHEFFRADAEFSDAEKSNLLDKFEKFAKKQRSFLTNDAYRRVAGDLYEDVKTDYFSLFKTLHFFNTIREKFGKNSIALQFFKEEDASALNYLKKISNPEELVLCLSCFKNKKIKNLDNFDDINEMVSRLDRIIASVNKNLKSDKFLSEVNIDEIKKIRDIQSWINKQSTSLKDILKTNFNDFDTDENLVKFLVQGFSILDESNFPIEKVSNKDFLETVKSNIEMLSEKVDYLKKDIIPAVIDNFDGNFFVFEDCEDIDKIKLNTFRLKIEKCLEKEQELEDYIEYQKVYSKISLNETIYSELVLKLIDKGYNLNHASILFEHIYYYSLLKQLNLEPEKFAEINIPNGQMNNAKLFKELDSDFIKINAKRALVSSSQGELVSGNSSGRVSSYTEYGLINHYLQKNGKMQKLTLRSFIQRAPKSLQAIFPCFLMSPMSVAQFIKPGMMDFDLVVIDEASQMPPENALGSIARSKQAIIVGDQKQLPPTAFFKNSSSDNDFGCSDEDEYYALNDGDESVLDKAASRFKTKCSLKWHYRSRHESLIAFSNARFYENKLTVFPSPKEASQSFGVFYTYIENGVYKNHTNVLEADAVINAVQDFIHHYPDMTLGVGTMNVQQQRLIERLFDDLCEKDPCVDAYRQKYENELEPFFVKNLENIQGDERDTIFISTVYGPSVVGGKVEQRFGPINSVNGQRRLNVLFTRAKLNLRVFSSMKPSDIVEKENSNEGLKVFHDYLEYAENRGNLANIGVDENRCTDSPFEDYVKEALEREGFIAVPQVGVNGYFIDLGVKHSQYPYGYIAGIECDGATYHSSKSSRDRDRIRQSVLEGLGWSIYRIWSTNWFSSPDIELKKLVAFLKETMEEKIKKIEIEKKEEADIFSKQEEFAQKSPNPGKNVVLEKKEEEGLFRFLKSQNDQNENDLDVVDAEFEEIGEEKINQIGYQSVPTRVEVGDKVTIYYTDTPNDFRTYQIVSVVPPNSESEYKIYSGSPLGQCLLGATVGDDVALKLDNRERYINILKVERESK